MVKLARVGFVWFFHLIVNQTVQLDGIPVSETTRELNQMVPLVQKLKNKLSIFLQWVGWIPPNLGSCGAWKIKMDFLALWKHKAWSNYDRPPLETSKTKNFAIFVACNFNTLEISKTKNLAIFGTWTWAKLQFYHFRNVKNE